ncbi:RcpC/CpaB family pilus assembly protein [Holdemania massiliensis]|uniref:RcpC/CpaB family pilus assembly protein n=1 Tax=Holdemania massiliensis TaxID=1468449 RepID=UPI001F06CFA9|nr:RcpC/CpaB family pilus assembly protein [Holdemania massiliensis]MCH1942439.1 Flp pilus assembly protein CpaB [Holdemania massiliensis]
MFKIKLFVKKHKAIVSMVLIAGIAIAFYLSYQSAVTHAKQLISVPVTNKYMSAGQIINESDITYMELPAAAVIENIYTEPQDIIGKVVNSYDSLAEKSLFYKALIKPSEEMKDVSLYDLKAGEIAITVNTDIQSSYANSILPGHQIDLYFSGTGIEPNSEDQKEKIVYGELVEAARVLAVYDEAGIKMGQLGVGDAATIVVALSYEDADLVGRAKHFGDVFPVISFESMHGITGNTFYDRARMKDAIYQRTIDLQLRMPAEENHE